MGWRDTAPTKSAPRAGQSKKSRRIHRNCIVAYERFTVNSKFIFWPKLNIKYVLVLTIFEIFAIII